MKERANELANAHYDNYVGKLLEAFGVSERERRIAEFVYKSTAYHFYLHAVEDMEKEGKATTRAAYANEAAAHNPFDEVAAGRLPKAFGPFVPHDDGEVSEGKARQIIAELSAKDPFIFPPALKFIDQGYTDDDYLKKLEEEIKEVWDELKEGRCEAALVEMFDVSHVMESWIRNVIATQGMAPSAAETAKNATFDKNFIRRYYAQPTDISSCAGVQCHMCETDECAVEKEMTQDPHDGMCASCDISDAACATMRDKSQPCNYYRHAKY